MKRLCCMMGIILAVWVSAALAEEDPAREGSATVSERVAPAPGQRAASAEPAEVLPPVPKPPEPGVTATEKVTPRKVEVDSDYDGKPDRTEFYDQNGQIARVEADTNGDGKIDDWVTYDGGRPVSEQRDSNGDGKVDVWIEY